MESESWTVLPVVRVTPNQTHLEFALQNMAQSVRFGRPVLFVIGGTLSGRFLVTIRLNWFPTLVGFKDCPTYFVTMGGLSSG